MQTGQISINFKDAALSDYEVTMTTTEGERVVEVMNGYTYEGIFEKICEQYSNEKSFAPDSISIRHIGYSLA